MFARGTCSSVMVDVACQECPVPFTLMPGYPYSCLQMYMFSNSAAGVTVTC